MFWWHRKNVAFSLVISIGNQWESWVCVCRIVRIEKLDLGRTRSFLHGLFDACAHALIFLLDQNFFYYFFFPIFMFAVNYSKLYLSFETRLEKNFEKKTKKLYESFRCSLKRQMSKYLSSDVWISNVGLVKNICLNTCCLRLSKSTVKFWTT